MIDSFGGMRPRAIDDALLDGFILALLLGRKVTIGLAFFDQLPRGRAMLVSIVGLKDQVFVVVESQPFKAFNDRTRRFIGGALQIGVFYPEQEPAPDLASEQPIE